MQFELVHLDADSGHCIGGVLLIGHVSDSIGLAVDAADHFGERILRTGEAYVAEGIG